MRKGHVTLKGIKVHVLRSPLKAPGRRVNGIV